jgi:hypothetical protein
MPSQVPVCPQLEGPRSKQTPRGSGAPRSTGEHLPVRPGSAQDTQAPVQAVSQQMPSAQKPLAHSPFVAQLATKEHTPSTQGFPPQSAGVAHLVEQEAVVVSHTKHGRAAAGAHAPWPSQASRPTMVEP